MKITIDTTQKTVIIESNVNLNDLFEQLEKSMPNGEWKEYKLITVDVIGTVKMHTYPPIVSNHNQIPYNNNVPNGIPFWKVLYPNF